MSPPHSIPLSRNIDVASKVLSRNSAVAQLKDSSNDVIDHEEYAEDYGYSSDSDLEDDEDEKVWSPKQGGKSKVHLLGWCGIPEENRIIPCEEHKENIKQGNVVKIPDMAFVT